MSSFSVVSSKPFDDWAIARDLSKIAEDAYKDPQQARRRLSKIDVPPELLYLKDAVFTHIIWAQNIDLPSEFDVQSKFFSSLSDHIMGAVQVFRPIIKEHRPDGFVEINGKLYVVEVKFRYFHATSLKQIQRYISAYKASGGIAVAPQLRCPLPSNVKFVSISLDGGAA